MGLLPAGLLVLIYAFPSICLASAQSSSSGNVSLPYEISRFVPTCAQKCFESFIELNYPTSTCGTFPTLDCLCSQPSISSFTPGEGALQCLIGEQSVGFCTGDDTTPQTRSLAYNMCSGQENAITPTHVTITATIIIQTEVPTSSATTIFSSKSSKLGPGTTNTRTSSPSSMSSTALATAAETHSTPATPNPTAQQSSEIPQPAPTPGPLNKTQIAGIVIGSVGGLAAAIGSLLLFACLKRRKLKMLSERDSDMFPFQESPNSMEVGFRAPLERKQGSPFAPGGTPNGIAARVGPRTPSPMKVIPQVPPRVNTDPYMFSRRTLRAEEIGVAISPETKTGGNLQRRPSNLLPDKPSLRLVTPAHGMPEPSQPLYFIPPNSTTRTPINDAQNRESTTTVFEMDSATTPYEYTRGISTHLPQRAEWPQNQPLAVSIAVPGETTIRPLHIRKSGVPLIPQISVNNQSFSQPLQPRTAASSVYSGYPSYVSDFNANNNFNSNMTSGHWQPPNLPNRQPPNQSSYKQMNPYAQEPSGQIQDEIYQGNMLEPRTPDGRTTELSPVQESPVGRSPVGKSPVSYPRIPSRLSDPAMKSILAGQPSPEWPRQTQQIQQYEAYGPQVTNRGAPPQQPNFGLRRPAEIVSSHTRGVRFNQSESEPWRAPELARLRDNGGRDLGRDLNPNTNNLSSIRESGTTRTNSEVSSYSMKSASSSLLAKRREKNGKAAQNLVLEGTVANPRATEQTGPKWRVVTKESDIIAAKSPDWRPVAGRQQVSRTDVEKRTDMERGELPSTPGWKPRLTPTRRGDDLYLDVQ